MIFGRADRPAVCGSLGASAEMCGANREHALFWLEHMELATFPERE